MTQRGRQPGAATALRWLVTAICAAVLVVATAPPALAEFGYAGGPDPGVSINPETGVISTTLPALSQTDSRDCLLSITRFREPGVESEVGLFRASIMNSDNLAVYLTSLGNVAPGDQVDFELINCSDVEPELQTSSTFVTASAKQVPARAGGSSGAIAAPALTLAALAGSLFAVRRWKASRVS